MARYSGVSTVSSPLAATAAARLYAEGGNAIDAAVAAAFALAVVEPQSSGIAGQAHMLVRDGASGCIEAIDAYSVAPQAASSDMYKWRPSPTQGEYRFNTVGDANTMGHLAIAVPGSLLGWCYLHRRFARLPLRNAVQPAIALARDGFIVDERLATALREHADKLGRFAASRDIWFKDEMRPLEAGARVVQADLARTLEQIADEGVETLYRGDIGQALVTAVKHGGGIITSDDLQRAYDELLHVRQPVESSFDGWSLSGAPPPTAGAALVSLIMKLLEVLAPELDDTFIVVLAEILRVALHKRASFFGRSDVLPDDVEQFLGRAHLRTCVDQVQKQIESRLQAGSTPHIATYMPEVADEETTHHSHLDSAGNCVVCTQSLGDAFGSGVTLRGYGLLLNNAMKLFDPRPDRPIGVAPFRKMLSSMTPMILQRDNGHLIGLGSPSGTRIISAVAQTLINHLWRGENLADAVAHPRIHLSGDHLEAEANLPQHEQATLERSGYTVRYLGCWDDWFGAVQVVARTSEEELVGAADPRRRGTAISYEMRQAIPS